MKKILIIEDDLIVGSVYKNLLDNRGFATCLEGSGPAGLKQMASFQPDAILLDIMLPDTNGVEVLKAIRAHPESASIPVVVFTNAYVPNMVNTAREAGANCVFSKSTLTSRQLLEALSALTTGGTYVEPTPGSPARPAQPAPSSGRGDPSMPPPSVSSSLINAVMPEAGSTPATEFFQKNKGPKPIIPFEEAKKKSTGNTTAISKAMVKNMSQDPHIQKMRTDFVPTIDASITKLRWNLSELTKAVNPDSQSGMLEELHQQVRTLGSNSGLAGFRPAADLCAAFEILLKELAEKPKNLNPSIQRTLANTVDILTELLVHQLEENLLENPQPAILVVDDEVLSRRAVTFALEKGNLKATAVSDPKEALQLATKQTFDLIFLDVQMPELNGFDLCTQIRAQLANQKTPVIFVTSMSDFKSRVRSTLSGATDLIAKPFIFFELTVKAVSTLLRARSQRVMHKLDRAA